MRLEAFVHSVLSVVASSLVGIRSLGKVVGVLFENFEQSHLLLLQLLRLNKDVPTTNITIVHFNVNFFIVQMILFDFLKKKGT